MNAMVPFHGVTLATAGRPDIRAMMQHFTAPYRAAVPFQDLIQTVQLNSTPARRSSNQRPSAAIAIRNAVAGHIDEIVRARDHLGVVILAPDDEDVRAVIAAMMMAFPAPPTETSSFFVDALVMELREPDVGDPFCLPAIAAAAREMWQTLPAAPSISQLLASVRKHQKRIEAVFKQLCDVVEASEWADDVIELGKLPVGDADDD